MGAGRVVARHGVVGAVAQTPLEGLEGEVEVDPARLGLAQAEPRLAPALVQLDEDAASERVVHVPQELELLLVLGEGLRVAALQREGLAETDEGSHDQAPGASGEQLLLELDGPSGPALGLHEVAGEGGAVRVLEGRPPGLRVEGQRALVAGHRLHEIAPQDEVDAADAGMGGGVGGIEVEGALEGTQRLVGTIEVGEDAALVAPGFATVGL